jgi:YebC/PmpR family DNA-binding regulatory protein
MSGHSKWANIKHRKGAQDAKRGKIFTRHIKEITMAAKLGGGDPEANPRLRSAIAGAKSVNMPKDNIARAIKKGIGGLDGESYEEIRYEGYGPGGVAVLVDCMTDNRNRTAGEVRHAFTKNNGNLGESGCVGFMFDRKGSIIVLKEDTDEETLMDIVLDAGAEDVIEEDDSFQVLTEPDEFEAVREAVEKAEIRMMDASVSMIPQNTVDVTDEKHAKNLMRLIDTLEDNDDVQDVHSNFDIPGDLLEKIM